ncbi:MAG: viroplasmin family protein [Tannerellaceae bacterium]
MAKQKYYVVWKGLNPGVYDNWAECKRQVDGQDGARYKSFESEEAALEAHAQGPDHYLNRQNRSSFKFESQSTFGNPIKESLAVDAACSGNPGKMEYRGVYVATGKELFHLGPMDQGTNNIGEFLALVHGLAFLKQNKSNLPIYSDSRNAILWVRNKKCKTKLEKTSINAPIFELIERAEKWLNSNTYTNQILKWETSVWGEIPADFGRK